MKLQPWKKRKEKDFFIFRENLENLGFHKYESAAVA